MLDEVYERSRLRTTALAVALTGEQLDTAVPATLLWTARQLLSHLAGAASDAVAGPFIEALPAFGPARWTSPLPVHPPSATPQWFDHEAVTLTSHSTPEPARRRTVRAGRVAA